MKLEGRVALVAGGAQGIGEGIAICLAEEGAHIAIADINNDGAKKVVESVDKMGRKGMVLLSDLTDEKQVTKVVEDTVNTFGKIDILVNVVGGASRETTTQLSEQAAAHGDSDMPEFMAFNGPVWDKYYELNLKSHVMLSRAVTPHFIKQRSGNIVNISSVSGRVPEPGHMPYGAMKAADISITWSFARALAPYNVRVNCICPGYVYTPLWDRGATLRYNQLKQAVAAGRKLPFNIDIDQLEKLSPREVWLNYMVVPGTPLGREQTAEDMGRAVVFFVSDDAKNVTGQTMHIDGGATMR